MAEFGGLRDAVAAVAAKIQRVQDLVGTIQNSTVVQDTVDEIQSSVEDLGTTLDGIIEDLSTPVDVPAETTPEETPA